MNESKLVQFKESLMTALHDLEAQDALGRDSQKTVELDQQSIGRLSRMDALQQQQLAIASQTRRDQLATRINAALKRIEEKEFGFCIDCGDEIEEQRLIAEPTIVKCLDCVRG